MGSGEVRVAVLVIGGAGYIGSHTAHALKRRGYEVVYVPAETATDVPDAAAALMARDIDAVLQIPGNLTASAFGSMVQ